MQLIEKIERLNRSDLELKKAEELRKSRLEESEREVSRCKNRASVAVEQAKIEKIQDEKEKNSYLDKKTA